MTQSIQELGLKDSFVPAYQPLLQDWNQKESVKLSRERHDQQGQLEILSGSLYGDGARPHLNENISKRLDDSSMLILT